MAMIEPKAADERRADESRFPTGLYLVRLAEVREVGPSAKFPNGNNRLVFDFEVIDGPYKGKRSAIFVGKSIFRDPNSGKESNLVKLARSMGVLNPEKGFDPDSLIHKHFNAMCEQDTSSPEGRTWVRSVIPAGGPAPVAPAGGPPRPPRPGHGEVRYWYAGPDGAAEPVLKNESEVRDLILTAEAKPADTLICREGTDAYRPIAELIPALAATQPLM